MTQIAVELRKPTPEGRLYYRDDPETAPSLWLIQSNQRRRIALSINIDGGKALLYFDSSRVLQDIELVRGKPSKSSASNFDVQQSSKAADICLVGIVDTDGKVKNPSIKVRDDGTEIRHYDANCKLTATVSLNSLFIEFAIGDSKAPSEYIALSDHCWAQVAGNVLQGFVVKLPGRR